MRDLIKFFPLMPVKKGVGKLILAILFYVAVYLVGSIVIAMLSLSLGWVIDLFFYPLFAMLGVVLNAYTILGIVFAIMSCCGCDFYKQTEESVTVEENAVVEENTVVEESAAIEEDVTVEENVAVDAPAENV